jgi:hypothetical protein
LKGHSKASVSFRCALIISVLAVFFLSSASAVEIATQDGMYLRFRGLTGELLSLVNRAEHIPLKFINESYPTFSITDYTVPERTGRIPTSMKQDDEDAITINGESDELKVVLLAEAKALPNYVKFSVQLLDTSGEDRSVTLRFQMPVEAEGWVWWDDVATSRVIEPGKRYVRYQNEERGIFPVWWYPVGSISEEQGHGLAFAIPMDPPTLGRVGYDGDFFIEFDVGLSKATSKFPSRADLTFYLYSHDAEWGFRSALKKYYDLFPRFFVKRVQREGLWLARTPTQRINRPEDFGITFHQVSSVKTNSLPVDDALGFYTFAYDEPGRVGISLPFEEREEGQPPKAENFLPEVFAGKKYRRPSQSYVLEKVQEFAADPESDQHRSAAATLALASQRPDGGFYLSILPRPGVGWRCLFSAATDPEIPFTEDNETRLDVWRKTQLARMLNLYDGRYDGQYIDSSEWMAETLNCRKDHFAYADYPLGFDAKTAKPGINTGVTRFEYLKAVSEELHNAGKLMMTNGTPMRYGFYTSLVDVAGSEVWHRWWQTPRGFGEKHIAEERTSVSAIDWRNERTAYLRRALVYQKPYCYLLKLMSEKEIEAFGMGRVQVYFDWSLFFAIYPSLSEGLWLNPEPYRDLYRKYIPVLRALGTAGWEPITHARADNPSLRVERHGYWSQGTLWFVVRNFSDGQASGNLTIDAEALAIGKGAVVLDALAGREADWEQGDAEITVPVDLGPARTVAFRIGLGQEDPEGETSGAEASGDETVPPTSGIESPRGDRER